MSQPPDLSDGQADLVGPFLSFLSSEAALGACKSIKYPLHIRWLGSETLWISCFAKMMVYDLVLQGAAGEGSAELRDMLRDPLAGQDASGTISDGITLIEISACIYQYHLCVIQL